MNHLVLEMGLALSLIALAAALSSWLRFSVVPFLILIGMAVGPHAPKIGPLDFRFIQSAPLIEFMGRAGVLFLLFYLGLEFSVSRLIKAGRSIVLGVVLSGATSLVGVLSSVALSLAFILGLMFVGMKGTPLLNKV